MNRLQRNWLKVVIVTGLSVLTSTLSWAETDDSVIGRTLRFTSAATSVDVTIGADTPAVRDLLSMLPMELEIQEYNGREKISYLPRKLDMEGTPGSDPEDGDLIYFVPWGNLGFYYNASGADYSARTPHIGTYDASREQLKLLEGKVQVELID